MTMGGSVRALTLLKGKGSQRTLSSLLTRKSLVVRSSSSLVNNTNRLNDNRTLGAPWWLSSSSSVGVVPNRLFSLSSRFRRAYPQYNIHGEEAMMSVKMIPPTFRAVKSDSVVMDQSRRGRLLLEFTARSSGRNYDWSNKVRFALSAEEVGLVCSQVPQHTVELVRKGHTTTTPFDDDSDSDSDDDDDYFGPVTNNMPDKVLTVTPGDVGTVSFRLDFIKDGVGGNKGPPLDVTVQAGEWEVLASLFRTALPALVGWTPLMDISMQSSIDDSETVGGGGHRSSGGGGGGAGNVPF